MEKKIISKSHYNDLIDALSAKVRHLMESGKIKVDNLYPIPRGGYYPAIRLSNILDIPVNVTKITPTSLVVDDIIDTANTIREVAVSNPCVAVFVKEHSANIPVAYATTFNEWLVLPDEKGNGIEDNIVRIFEHIGEDPKRVGLIGTPDRIVRMWEEIFRGYDPTKKPKITVFPNGEDGLVYDNMVVDEGNYYSMCEHHMMPFFGKYWFAYIPNPKGKILGISKIGRVVDYCAAKLQVQERLTKEVVDMLADALGTEYPPLGVALVMRGTHLCKSMRGVKKNGTMTSSYLTGVFQTDSAVRAEFMNMVKS